MTDWSKKSTQQIFNHIARHLVKQKRRAIDPVLKSCVCHNKETGLRCAVGSLIPLKSYKDDFYNLGRIIKIAMTGTEVDDERAELLYCLQGIHDSVKPSRWAQKLRKAAKDFKLEVPAFLKEA